MRPGQPSACAGKKRAGGLRQPLCVTPQHETAVTCQHPDSPAYVHHFVFGPEVGHQHVLPVGHAGERDAHSARDERVHVGREVPVQGLAEEADHAEGRVQDAQGPAPDGLDKASEDLQSEVCGGDKHIKGWRGTQEPGGGSCVLTGGVVQTEMC